MELRHQQKHDRDVSGDDRERREQEAEQPQWPGKRARTDARGDVDTRVPDLRRIRGALGALRAGGKPLPGAMARQYGQLLGIDLSDVRVHQHGAAAAAAKSIGATAFTAGTDIALAEHLDVDSAFGRHVLAHELVHVAQNKRSGGAMDLAARLEIGPSGSAVEAEAERGAAAITAGQPFTVAAHGRLPGISRFNEGETAPTTQTPPVGVPGTSTPTAPTAPTSTPTADPAAASPSPTPSPSPSPAPSPAPAATPDTPGPASPGPAPMSGPRSTAPAPTPGATPGSPNRGAVPQPTRPAATPIANIDERVREELERRADPTATANYSRGLAGVDALRVQALQFSFTPTGIWNTLVETFVAPTAFRDHWGQIYSTNAYRGGRNWADTAQAWIEGLRGVVHIIGDIAAVVSAWAGLVAVVTGVLALIFSETVIGGIALGAIAAIAAEVALIAGAIKLLTDIIDFILGIVQMIILIIRARNSKDPGERARFAQLLRKEANDFGANVISIGTQVAVMAVSAGIGAGLNRGAQGFLRTWWAEFSRAASPFKIAGNLRGLSNMVRPVTTGPGRGVSTQGRDLLGRPAERRVLNVDVDQGLVGIQRLARNARGQVTRNREIVPFTPSNQMRGARLVTLRNSVRTAMAINTGGVIIGLKGGQLQAEVKAPRGDNGGTSPTTPSAQPGNLGQRTSSDLSTVQMWPTQLEMFQNAQGPLPAAVARTYRQYEMAEQQAGPELAAQVRQAFQGANNTAGEVRFGATAVQRDATDGLANTQQGLQQTGQARDGQTRMGAAQDRAGQSVDRIQNEGTRLRTPEPRSGGILDRIYNATIGQAGAFIARAQRWVTNLVGKWAMSLAGFSKEEMDIAGIENDMREDALKDQNSTQEAQDAALRADTIQQTVFQLQENKTRDEQNAIQAMADAQRFIAALEDAEQQLAQAVTNGQSYIDTVTPIIRHELETEAQGAAIDNAYIAPVTAWASAFTASIDQSNVGGRARDSALGQLGSIKAAYPDLDDSPARSAIGTAVQQYETAFGQLASQAQGQAQRVVTQLQAFIGTRDYDGVSENAHALERMAADFDRQAQQLADSLYQAINNILGCVNQHIQAAIDAAMQVPDEPDAPADETPASTPGASVQRKIESVGASPAPTQQAPEVQSTQATQTPAAAPEAAAAPAAAASPATAPSTPASGGMSVGGSPNATVPGAQDKTTSTAEPAQQQQQQAGPAPQPASEPAGGGGAPATATTSSGGGGVGPIGGASAPASNDPKKSTAGQSTAGADSEDAAEAPTSTPARPTPTAPATGARPPTAGGSKDKAAAQQQQQATGGAPGGGGGVTQADGVGPVQPTEPENKPKAGDEELTEQERGEVEALLMGEQQEDEAAESESQEAAPGANPLVLDELEIDVGGDETEAAPGGNPIVLDELVIESAGKDEPGAQRGGGPIILDEIVIDASEPAPERTRAQPSDAPMVQPSVTENTLDTSNEPTFEAAVNPDDVAVQRRGTGAATTANPVEVAQRATSGAGGRLPHLDTIQASFGRHDVSSIRAHEGGAAKEGASQLGAAAFAVGDAVAFKSTPDLHTAAHEAAHVVQQRAGLRPSGGIDGGASDSLEQHADAVADAVVAGKSAQPLLDSMVGGAAGGARTAGVQRKGETPTIKSEVRREAPDGGSKERYIVAVGEDVTFTSSVKGTWTASGGKPASGEASETFDWAAPGSAGQFTIKVKTEDDKEATKDIAVVEPSKVTFGSSGSRNYPAAGKIGFSLGVRITLLPLSVSFANNTSVIELPGGPAVATGYFKEAAKKGLDLNHHPKKTGYTIDWGNTADDDASIMDSASEGDLPRPISVGTLTWHIPYAYSAGDVKDKPFTILTQTMSIVDSEGTTTISKGTFADTKKVPAAKSEGEQREEREKAAAEEREKQKAAAAKKSGSSGFATAGAGAAGFATGEAEAPDAEPGAAGRGGRGQRTRQPAQPETPPGPATITHQPESFAMEGDNDRRTVGVGERVNFASDQAGTWTATTVGRGGQRTVRNARRYRWVAPSTAASATITFTPRGAGATPQTFDMTVIPPSGVDFIIPTYDTYPAGRQGAGMVTNVRFLPFTVSFYRTQWKEMPGPASGATGYFAGRRLPYHHPNANWLSIREGNGGPTDHAAFWGFPAPWTAGSFNWVIPNRYRVRGDSSSYEIGNVTQSCVMEGAPNAGTTTVTKGSSSATRAPGAAPPRPPRRRRARGQAEGAGVGAATDTTRGRPAPTGGASPATGQGKTVETVLAELERSAKTLVQQLQIDAEYQKNVQSNRAESPVIGWTVEATARASEAVGNTVNDLRGKPSKQYVDKSVSVPPVSAWQPARDALAEGTAALARARQALTANHREAAQAELDRARAALDRGRAAFEVAHRRLHEYVERTIGGGETALTILQGLEVACATVLAIGSGVWVAGVLQAGAAAGGTAVLGMTVGGATSASGMTAIAATSAGTTFATTATLGAAKQLSAGEWDPIKIVREAGTAAAATFATTLLGGVAAKVFTQALGAALSRAAQTMGPEAVAAVSNSNAVMHAVNFLGGASSGGFMAAIQTVIDRHLRGEKPLSPSEFSTLVITEMVKAGLMQLAISSVLRHVKVGAGDDAAGKPGDKDPATYGAPATNEPLVPVPDEVLGSQIHNLPGDRTNRGGLAILDAADPHMQVVKNPQQRVPGWFDVVVHGTDVGEAAGGFRIMVRGPDGKVTSKYLLTPEKLAALVRDSNWRSGMPIRLFACRAGRLHDGGVAPAAELARILRTEVIASNQVNVDTPRGFAAYPLERKDGIEYNMFKPETSTLKVKPGFDNQKIAGGKGEAAPAAPAPIAEAPAATHDEDHEPADTVGPSAAGRGRARGDGTPAQPAQPATLPTQAPEGQREVAGPTLESQTLAVAADGADNRTTVGVGEKVKFSSDTKGTWEASAVGPNGEATPAKESLTYTWTAPATASSVTVKLTTQDGKSSSKTMTVIAPSSVEFLFPTALDYKAGTQGVGMVTAVRFMPLSVSFSRTSWLEVPHAASNIQGYFTQHAPPYHHPNKKWLPVGGDGMNGGIEDTAAFWGFPSPWSAGSFDWVVPNKYKVQGESGDGHEFAQVTQRCVMEGDPNAGRTTVSKGTSSMTRAPSQAPAKKKKKAKGGGMARAKGEGGAPSPKGEDADPLGSLGAVGEGLSTDGATHHTESLEHEAGGRGGDGGSDLDLDSEQGSAWGFAAPEGLGLGKGGADKGPSAKELHGLLETYLDYNTPDIWRAFGEHLLAIQLPQPHGRLEWGNYNAFLDKLHAHFKDWITFRPLSTFDEMIYPSNSVRSLGAHVPTSKVWVPQVGIAVSHALHIAVVASLKRLGPRYLDIADSRGAEGVRDPDALIKSMPIDRYVAPALCVPGALRVVPLDPKAAKAAKGKTVKLRDVTFTYEGAHDPALWNWIRVSPADATPEEVAAKVWAVTDVAHGDTHASFNAYALASAPPLFGLPKKQAIKTKAGDYAPKDALAGGDSVNDRLLALAGNRAVDSSALNPQPSSPAPKTNTTPHAKLETLRTALGDCKLQLAFVQNEVTRWGLASRVSPALGYLQRKHHEIETLDATGLDQWGPVFEGQKARLSRISGGLHLLGEAARKLNVTDPKGEAATPIREVFELFAIAAGISHIPQAAEAKLQQALHAQGLLTVRALQSTEASMMGALRDVHGLAGDNKHTGKLSSEALALQERSRRLQAHMLSGSEVNAEELDDVAMKSEEVALESRMYGMLSALVDLNKAAREARDEDAEIIAAIFSGDFQELPALTKRIVESIAPIRNNWNSVRKGFDQEERHNPTDKRRAQNRRDRREALVRAKAGFERIVEDRKLNTFLQEAAKMIRNQQFRTAIVRVAAMIGISVAGGVLGGLAARAVGGMFMQASGATVVGELGMAARTGMAITNIAVDSTISAAGTSVIQGGSFGDAWKENVIVALGTSAVFGSINRYAVEQAKLEERVAKTWSQASKGGKAWIVVKEAGVLTAHTLWGAAMGSVAGKLVHGQPQPPPETISDWALQGVSVAVGKHISTRITQNSKLYKQLEESAEAKGRALYKEAAVLKDKALALVSSKKPNVALDLLAEHDRFMRREIEAIDAALAKTKDGTRIAELEAHRDRIELAVEAAGSHGMVETRMALTGLEELVPGALWKGTEQQVRDAEARTGGKATRDTKTGRWKLKVGNRTIEIHDVGSPRVATRPAAPRRAAAEAIAGTDFHGNARGKSDAAAVRDEVVKTLAGLPKTVGTPSGQQVTVRVKIGKKQVEQVIRFVVEPPTAAGPDAPIATYDVNQIGTAEVVVTVSDRAADGHVTRAVRHEIAEISSRLATNDLGKDLPNALARGSNAQKLSHHDRGRLAELDALRARDNEARRKIAKSDDATREEGTAEKARVEKETRELLSELGLIGDGPEFDRRRALAGDAKKQADAILKKAPGDEVWGRISKPRVSKPKPPIPANVLAISRATKIGHEHISAILEAEARALLTREELIVVNRVRARAERGVAPLAGDVARLRLLVSDGYTAVDQIQLQRVYDLAKRIESVSPASTADAAGAGRDTVIVDSNLALVIDRPAANVDEAKWKTRLGSEQDVRASDVVLQGEADPSKAISSSTVRRYPLLVPRNSQEYNTMISVMVRHRVGGGSGAGDQLVAAEAFFAKTTDGQPATLKTADEGMVRGLLRASGRDPQTVDLVDRFTFVAEVNGRRLKVEFWAGAD